MLAVGSDHAALGLKRAVIDYLDQQGIAYTDYGSAEKGAAEYPVIAKDVAQAVSVGLCEYGILLCGTGIGMSIAANKVKGIRAAVCSDGYSARLTRLHNDANILCMGERVIGQGLAMDILEAFLHTSFEGGRHARRVELIAEMEK